MKIVYIAALVCTVPAFVCADRTEKVSSPTINTTTIAASTVLSPGTYVTTIAPSFNGDMGKRLEKSVAGVAGIKEATAKTEDSTIRFTVKNGSKLQVSELQKAVQSANTGAVMSTPLLENSMKPTLGPS